MFPFVSQFLNSVRIDVSLKSSALSYCRWSYHYDVACTHQGAIRDFPKNIPIFTDMDTHWHVRDPELDSGTIYHARIGMDDPS